jgi:predicted ATPase
MSDPRNRLQALFDEPNRFANFGDVMTEISIRGIRCHENTHLRIESPITALCGLNGTGKSTILQLAATAFRSPDGPYSVGDFMVVSALDPAPFTSDARVEFKFWQENRTPRTLTVSRNAASRRWSGYSRRRARTVFFAGIGMYLPRHEQPSFVSRARWLAVSQSNDVVGRVHEWTCKILGNSYSKLLAQVLNIRDRRGGKISSVQKGALTYSEAHMGFGEARTIHIVTTLESLPDRSLILIEEPETSLHLSAQHEFGRYLVDVCNTKRHQVFVTTHSEFLLQSLPSASRIYLHRTDRGVESIPGLTAIEAKSLMAVGKTKALTVLVEDECARAILTEIVRRHDPAFHQSLHICVGGDKDRIRQTVVGLKQTSILIAAVRDGDKEGDPRENIFKLPGSQPPEKELFGSAAVSEYVATAYGLNLADFQIDLLSVDHHYWCERLADRVGGDPVGITWELARPYVKSLREGETMTLVELLKEATRR